MLGLFWFLVVFYMAINIFGIIGLIFTYFTDEKIQTFEEIEAEYYEQP